MMKVLGLLGGLWLAAALLHNGSVQAETMWVLLLPMAYVAGMLILRD